MYMTKSGPFDKFRPELLKMRIARIPYGGFSQIRLYRLIQHPHLSSLLGVVPIHEGKIAIVTPLVKGANLHDLIFGDGRRKVYRFIVLCTL